MARRRRQRKPLSVESLTHEEAGRPNIPTAEYQALLKDDEQHPIEVAFERRNPDLDPQLVWRGKDPRDWSDLVTTAPPLYIQEKVHPKALIDDLRRSGQRSAASGQQEGEDAPAIQIGFADFFADFNGLPEGAERTDFYQHQANWSNRMILGDSLHVMASLAERERAARPSAVHLHRPTLRHQVQLKLPVVNNQPGCARRKCGPHYPGAGAGEGLPRYLA